MSDINYTDQMVTEMTSTYLENPTLDTAREIASHLGKSTKSVVAKLVSLGIYKKAVRATKSGSPVVQKATLVKEIEKATGLTMPSLVKATKADLLQLKATLAS